MHALCSCLWLFVHLCMLSASTCLTITTLQHRRFDPTYTSLQSEPILLAASKKHKSNPMFHLCLCHPTPPEGKCY